MIVTLAIAAVAAVAPNSSGVLWVGPQAATLSVIVSGARGGVPHPCVTNNGPDSLVVADNAIVDAHHTVTGAGVTLAAGRTFCWAHGTVTLPATWHVTAIDEANGNHGTAVLAIRPTQATHPTHRRKAHVQHLQPLQPTSIVASVQAAAGRLAVDGDYGPLTAARLAYVTAHWRAMPGTIERIQGALGVTVDGVVGQETRDALMLLRNASFGRYLVG